MTICIATQNQGKVKEFQYLAQKFSSKLAFCSLSNITDAPPPQVEEHGDSFLENAKIKAKAYGKWLKNPCLSDDSGLVVEALNGEPGLYSARYAGFNATDQQNNEKLLQELSKKSLDKPKAKFVCVLACYDPATDTFLIAEGELDGYILSEPKGNKGFGYNPLFFVESKQKTLAQMDIEEKLALDHRSLAFQALSKELETKLS